MNKSPVYELKKDYKNSSPLVRPGRIWEKLLPDNVPRTIQYPEIPVHSIGREAARKYPHNLAIYHVETERKYTYLELMHVADKLAAGLYELGVRKGDGVGIYMTNSPEFIFTVYAISLNGAIATRLTLTGTATPIAIVRIAVVTFLTYARLNNIVTAYLALTGTVAPITIRCIAIITLFVISWLRKTISTNGVTTFVRTIVGII